MAVLPDRNAVRQIAAFLDEHAGWSVFWDKRFGVWRVSEDDPASKLYTEDADADRVIGYMGAMAGDACSGEAPKWSSRYSPPNQSRARVCRDSERQVRWSLLGEQGGDGGFRDRVKTQAVSLPQVRAMLMEKRQK